MKLTKPMYGLCDAPRAWFEEASERILEVGHGRIIQHPLDACLFMVFNEVPEAAKKAKLVGLFGLHVDDLFGCFDTKDLPMLIKSGRVILVLKKLKEKGKNSNM